MAGEGVAVVDAEVETRQEFEFWNERESKVQQGTWLSEAGGRELVRLRWRIPRVADESREAARSMRAAADSKRSPARKRLGSCAHTLVEEATVGGCSRRSIATCIDQPHAIGDTAASAARSVALALLQLDFTSCGDVGRDCTDSGQRYCIAK